MSNEMRRASVVIVVFGNRSILDHAWPEIGPSTWTVCCDVAVSERRARETVALECTYGIGITIVIGMECNYNWTCGGTERKMM